MSTVLTHRARWALSVSLAVFFGIQAVQLPLSLFFGKDLWPFAPYSMFSYLQPARMRRPHVVLHDSSGRTQLVEPGHVLPIEFFRANALLRSTYSPQSDPRPKVELARAILTRLRQGPWDAFDEVWAAARPSPGATFTRLEVTFCEWDFTQYRYGADYRPECEPPVFSYPLIERSSHP
ncbi:hypothetical protein ACSRUE_41715 [Sorangium sp. KYC3313]|uniref:hypothetical protein n=1 Tax=Sorangium sp. KYC3313 TaxID=3449740 RepID=UPI003F88E28E